MVPAITGSGESTFVTDKSAEPAPTVVAAVALLLPGVGSVVADDNVAVLLSTVPALTPAPTCATRVNAALPMANDAFVQLTAPAAPTAGVVQLQPAGEVSDTKVVPVGKVSDSDTVDALLGPALLAVIV